MKKRASPLRLHGRYSSVFFVAENGTARISNCLGADMPVHEFRRRTASAPFRKSVHIRDESRSPSPDNEPIARLRMFTIDPKVGLINRGDSFRSLNLTPMSGESGPGSLGSVSKDASDASSRIQSPAPQVRRYDVLVLGAEGVGKSVTINQFMTSEYCNFFNEELIEESGRNSVFVRLDEEVFELTFVEVNVQKDENHWLSLHASGYIVVYSVDDKTSLKIATDAVKKLKQCKLASQKPIVLVGNKIDLERKRATSTEDGKIVAKENKCKFVEISVAIGHKVDELLVGILNQIRQKNQRKHADVGNRQIVINVSDDEESIGKFPDKPRFMSKPRLSASCSNFTLVGQRFLNKLLKSRNCSKSVEDLLSVTF